MWYRMGAIVYLALTLCTISLATGRCRKGSEFFNEDTQACEQCSKCPQNKIIKEPCTETQDVQCKSFTEFRNFNQIDTVQYTNDKEEEGASDPGHDITIKEIPAITKDEGEYWRNLAFALIGVLCALIVVATIIVLCACRKLHETAALKRPEEDDYDDTDSGYVVIRQIRQLPLPSNSRSTSEQAASSFQSSRHQKMPWLYRPKRRLLNEYVDDVFESEDSAGSRASRKLPLTVIPERESEGNSSGSYSV
ncbi:uncharacterized protein LOC124143170 [Haliotis rufescens]|uniref:uncharacterized protein LOC124143170 n=1 Tax=Haliotis rufescens TaxID=6454 RepID=UPI001EAF988E|nr:uncharacterized protein LOC124143170 [Haliotis rufescens]